VIDDPIRSREDAASEIVRRSIWEWYLSDVRSRQKPGCRIVLISTRWHMEDLPGRLLREAEEGTGEKWDTLIVPPVADENDPIGRKPGEYLWSDGSEDYDYAGFLKREQATQSPMNWSALYQQRPVPETGNYFKLEWLKPYEQVPDSKTLRVYAASDFAVTSKGGDYTVHLIVGVDPQSHMYVLDLYRKQAGPDHWVEEMLTLAAKWRPIFWAQEAGVIKGSVGPFLERRSRERKIPVFLKTLPASTTSRPARSRSAGSWERVMWDNEFHLHELEDAQLFSWKTL
jgi:hypothetical protein